jgi:anti-sigma-K factor RskA
MSMLDEADDLGPPDLAAAYVLGTLEAAEAEAARARAESDPDFAREIAFWENRLAPLALLVPAVAPPAALWTRIEDSTGGNRAQAMPRAPAPANDNQAGWWRVTALASLAVAAGLAAFIALRPPPPAPSFAVLAPMGSTAPFLVAIAGPNGGMFVRPSGALAVPPDRDLELWSLPAGATKPASLGVLPAGGKQIGPGIVPGTQLLVSLEPKGGSRTGLPTGPVVYGGTLRGI